MNTPRLSLRACLLGAAAAISMCCANALHAQADYPVKPVRLVVAFPPGDPTDLVSRVLAQKMSEQMGQQVVVDNRPGANGNFAAEVVAKSAPDGYTVFYNTSAIALSPALYAKLGYDVLADFSPVALTAVVPLVLAVHPSMPMANVREFVAYAKAHPGKLTYGSAGNGNVTHLASFLFLQANGIDAVHAPYKGSAPALTDAAGGQVQFITDTINSALPFIKDKRLRALAVTSARRTTVLPEVPTLAETLMPGFEVGAWQGMLVPAGTPPAVVRRLSQEVNKALASPEVKARLAVQGAEPLGSTPEQYGAYIRGELERWAKVVKQIGAKLD